MKAAVDALWKLRIWADNHGADLIEYTLLAGFVALSAAAVIPGVATSISRIFNEFDSTRAVAGAQTMR